MVDEVLRDAERRMQRAVEVLDDDLKRIRTGRASPALVEKLTIDYYGVPTPLIQLAAITVPEPRQLNIKPFDPKTIPAIERAIMTSDLGLTPNTEGSTIRLFLPPLTEERRAELVRLVHKRVEQARIAIRNVRRDALKDLREMEEEKMISEDERRRAEEKLQKLTETYIEKANDLGKRKEREIMER
ncbi:MAG: ribosome recycling factor [Chloroflexi bacterium]|nr:ribosome recycling factor [Chloroflexota bacterium]